MGREKKKKNWAYMTLKEARVQFKRGWESGIVIRRGGGACNKGQKGQFSYRKGILQHSILAHQKTAGGRGEKITEIAV